MIDCSLYVDEGDDTPIPFLCEGCRNGVCPRNQGASPEGGSVDKKAVSCECSHSSHHPCLVDKQSNWL